MSEMSGAGTIEWNENAALLEKRANSAEKQVQSLTMIHLKSVKSILIMEIIWLWNFSIFITFFNWIQVKHMASLLSESEGENARLIQLAQVLKEEIRSYRRSEERSKHIDNLEYVKNVILKVSARKFLQCWAGNFLTSKFKSSEMILRNY